MTNNRKKIVTWSLSALLLLILAGSLVGYKLYTKPHRNVETGKAIRLPATELADAYESNETVSNTKYLDQILEVTGEVTDVTKNQKGETVLSLKGTAMSGLICTLVPAATKNVQPGTSITVRGICTGYLTDVVLVRAMVVSNN